MLSIPVPTVERTVQSEHRELNLSLSCTARLLCQLILSWAPVQAVIIEQLLGEKALETPAMTWHISLWIIGSWSVLVKALIRWYSSNLIQSKFKKTTKKQSVLCRGLKKWHLALSRQGGGCGLHCCPEFESRSVHVCKTLA